MQPYQKAAEVIRSGEEYPLNLLKNVGLTALGGGAAAVGSKFASRLIPAIGSLINKYVPNNIATAGLKKIDPRFNKFIEGAIAEGYSHEDVRQFLEDKIEKTQSQEPAKENRNVIQQYSPELFQYLDDQVKKGRSPIEAGAIAQNEKRFSDIIKKLSKDHKTSWSNILQSVFGSPDMAQPESKAALQSPQNNGVMQNSGDEALIAAAKKILSM